MRREEEDAFDAFVRGRMSDLLRFGHMLTGNPDAAADLVQDALERTLAAWPRVRNRDDPEGYVRRTMVNRNVSVWRRRRREYLTDDVPESGQHHDPQLPDQDLQAALDSLPRRQRAVIVLRFAEDLSERQTADMLGCSVGTVKSQTSKALAKLRVRLPEAAGTLAPDSTPMPRPARPIPEPSLESTVVMETPAEHPAAVDHPAERPAAGEGENTRWTR
ncbi:SigE family RNA polymerase sigma factor [Actinopolymorpha sp. NPDC004070]|uniref:SigE family RNA polymerase sigma factor n=1 Tax=Actinopolymorpha sp. NPDC004070 TaxID=3154548 RepID=UPI00339E00FF